MAASLKVVVFGVVVSRSLVEVYWHFKCSYCITALMMEAASASKMSVNFYQTTWCNNPEDSHLFPDMLVTVSSEMHYNMMPLTFLQACSCSYSGGKIPPSRIPVTGTMDFVTPQSQYKGLFCGMYQKFHTLLSTKTFLHCDRLVKAFLFL
jgi:hypothetical protein